ncbi:hypothetical protein [Dietzia sp. 179-F 9C3 NHS]|uniref:hypothetical protein n=1 Tax=Dietzia sp. 179-F 9C3 NHS TaxID=3374295 RepID=UPI00387A4A9F
MPDSVLTVGDSDPHLATLGALAAAIDSHDNADTLDADLEHILSTLAETWVPEAGAPTWTTSAIARRDAARHLVNHHGMTITAASQYCRTWPEDVLPGPERDRLNDPAGRWWITETGNLARTYGYSELSDLDVVAYRSNAATYSLMLLPACAVPYVGKETQMREMTLWTPVDAATAATVLTRWGKDHTQVATIDSNITHIF